MTNHTADEYPGNMPDSEWLSQVTAEAFNQGRIELGAALARLAVQAHRMERDARPTAPVDVLPAHIYEEVNRTGPIFTTGRAPVETPELAAPEPAAEADQLPAAPNATAVTPSARCIAVVGPPGQQGECHGVLFWAQFIGEDSGHWEHLDPLRLRTDHTPMADRPVDVPTANITMIREGLAQ